MSKAFWQGFREGYRRSVLFGGPFAFGLLVGWTFCMYFHPYEECKRMYDSLEDISECVWIKENE